MNTQSKHTPGPWRATHEGYIASENNGYVPIRTPFRKDAFDDGPTRSDHKEETLQANARLIAAAPAMLEALRYAAELIPTARRYFPKSVKFSDRFQLENVCATIGKAIAQAEGGAQ